MWVDLNGRAGGWVRYPGDQDDPLWLCHPRVPWRLDLAHQDRRTHALGRFRSEPRQRGTPPPPSSSGDPATDPIFLRDRWCTSPPALATSSPGALSNTRRTRPSVARSSARPLLVNLLAFLRGRWAAWLSPCRRTYSGSRRRVRRSHRRCPLLA